jgi:rubrerythrin
MKKLLFLSFLMIGSIICFAQQTPAAVVDTAKKAANKHVQNPAAWACPKCFKITKDGGTCADDNTAKVQLGTYYCEHCMKTTGNKPGKCPSCGNATTQMTRKLCGQHNAPAKKAA